MKIIELTDKAGKKKFLSFRRKLYAGDKNYVMTSEFVLTDLLYGRTDFARECYILPVAVTEEENILAESLFIFNAKLPVLQIGFFEAKENVFGAVDLLLRAAKQKAVKLGAKEVVVGLNAHISYGVGILTDGFDFKNSFDSNYNKSYYKDYFRGMKSVSLSTYRGTKTEAEKRFVKFDSSIHVRHADMKNFEAETEIMRSLCEKTIAKTYLYYRTEKGHFYQLMRDLKPFLSGENLLFAENAEGEAIGFLFWHPDFNQMLKGGRNYSTAGIALAWLFNRKNIDTVKLNAIGTLSVGATAALVTEFERLLGVRYTYVETNFVWDNNLPSTRINRRFFSEPHRKYEVYFTDASTESN